MLFNSLEFAIFLPIVFIIYWFCLNKSHKFQNIFIVAISYLFYGWWDWRFLLLIAFTTTLSFISGTLITKYRKLNYSKYNLSKIIAATNIIINLGILGVFKYLNFFSENFAKLFRTFGYEMDWVTLEILLPVGISFYTFQALSYTIDVYKQKIESTKDVVSFFAFVSFFPQLVAGPIERATQLLPQFYKQRNFDYIQSISGLRQILWGLFKKIAIADNCAPIVNSIFSNIETSTGSTLLIGAILFSFQIYGDFSGYSDIARGVAKLFGFDLMLNFKSPYLSRDIAEFWRRWHISLNTWFRDYIYIPLGGSHKGKLITIRNTVVIFLVSGFWHGASWTFICWGIYHALLFIPIMLINKNRKHLGVVAENKILPSITDFLRIVTTFILVMIGWILFRAPSIEVFGKYMSKMFSASLFSIPNIVEMQLANTIECFVYILILMIFEWNSRREDYVLKKMNKYLIIRWTLYLLIAFLSFISYKKDQDFIYFQF